MSRWAYDHKALSKEDPVPLYEKGDIRIHFEEAGSGFPLLVIPGGWLNSTIAGLATHPFNPFDEFKNEYRVISADLRNANGGSVWPAGGRRPWDAYTDDHIGLMDHLGIRQFHGAGLLHRRSVHLEPWSNGSLTGSSLPYRRSRVATVRRCPACPITTT